MIGFWLASFGVSEINWDKGNGKDVPYKGRGDDGDPGFTMVL